MECLSKDHEDHPNHHVNSHDEIGPHVVNVNGKSMETEKTTWSEFPNGGKTIVEQVL